MCSFSFKYMNTKVIKASKKVFHGGHRELLYTAGCVADLSAEYRQCGQPNQSLGFRLLVNFLWHDCHHLARAAVLKLHVLKAWHR